MTSRKEVIAVLVVSILLLFPGLAACTLAVWCSFLSEQGVHKYDIFFPKNGEAFEPQNVQITASRFEISLDEMKNLPAEKHLPIIVVPQWNKYQVTIEYWLIRPGGAIYHSVERLPIDCLGIKAVVDQAIIKGNKEVWVYTKPNIPTSVGLCLVGILCIAYSIVLFSSSTHKLRK